MKIQSVEFSVAAEPVDFVLCDRRISRTGFKSQKPPDGFYVAELSIGRGLVVE